MYRRPETKAAEEKVFKQKQIGEFMTTWKDFPRPGLAAWAERRKAGLMGTAKSTRYTPRFRPFDMLSIPNQSLVILDNEYHRIGVESVVGVQDSFHRYIDSDMVYFQFCGNSTVETEFGVYEMEPGEVMLVPGGIAHRSIGRNDSLRYFCQSHEAVDYVMNEDQYTSQTSFEVKRIGGPNWTAAQGRMPRRRGRSLKRCISGTMGRTTRRWWSAITNRSSLSPDCGAVSREVMCASYAPLITSRRSSARAAKTPVPSR
jgi:hypothetical protein